MKENKAPALHVHDVHDVFALPPSDPTGQLRYVRSAALPPCVNARAIFWRGDGDGACPRSISMKPAQWRARAAEDEAREGRRGEAIVGGGGEREGIRCRLAAAGVVIH
jgi:hypothetical protein